MHLPRPNDSGATPATSFVPPDASNTSTPSPATPLDPDPRAQVLPDPADPTEALLSKVYLTFLVLGGDVDRTAATCNVATGFVRRHSDREDWREKIEAVANLGAPTGRGPSELERVLARTAGYVQALRLRRIVDAVISALEARVDSGADVLGAFTVVDRQGARLDFGSLETVMKTVERLHGLCQEVLCDTPAEREGRRKAEERNGRPIEDLGRLALAGLQECEEVQDSGERALLALGQGIQTEA